MVREKLLDREQELRARVQGWAVGVKIIRSPEWVHALDRRHSGRSLSNRGRAFRSVECIIHERLMLAELKVDHGHSVVEN